MDLPNDPRWFRLNAQEATMRSFVCDHAETLTTGLPELTELGETQ